MGITTQIEWCDSTLNAMMGCGGCELWIPKAGVRDCYAGVLTERYAGLRGWPEAFDRPRHFPDRLEAALRWPDLTSTARPGKPWLDYHVLAVDEDGEVTFSSIPPERMQYNAEHFRMGPAELDETVAEGLARRA